MRLNLFGASRHILDSSTSLRYTKETKRKSVFVVICVQSRSQSLRSPCSAVGKTRALGATISGMRHRCRLRSETRWAEFGYFPLLFQNGCSQSSRFPTAGQGERRLWARDRPFSSSLVPLFQNETRSETEAQGNSEMAYCCACWHEGLVVNACAHLWIERSWFES